MSDRHTIYRDLIDRASVMGGNDWATWNARYMIGLGALGLVLVPWDKPLRPPASICYAPHPTKHENGPHWPLSLLVQKNDLPWFYRYAVGELVRISACDPASVVPWAGKLCGPLQTDYATLFTDVLETRQRRLLAFAGGLAKL